MATSTQSSPTQTDIAEIERSPEALTESVENTLELSSRFHESIDAEDEYTFNGRKWTDRKEVLQTIHDQIEKSKLEGAVEDSAIIQQLRKEYVEISIEQAYANLAFLLSFRQRIVEEFKSVLTNPTTSNRIDAISRMNEYAEKMNSLMLGSVTPYLESAKRMIGAYLAIYDGEGIVNFLRDTTNEYFAQIGRDDLSADSRTDFRMVFAPDANLIINGNEFSEFEDQVEKRIEYLKKQQQIEDGTLSPEDAELTKEEKEWDAQTGTNSASSNTQTGVAGQSLPRDHFDQARDNRRWIADVMSGRDPRAQAWKSAETGSDAWRGGTPAPTDQLTRKSKNLAQRFQEILRRFGKN